jgi:hypothetical protein
MTSARVIMFTIETLWASGITAVNGQTCTHVVFSSRWVEVRVAGNDVIFIVAR